MATHSSIRAWKIPQAQMGYSPRGCKESDTTGVTECVRMCTHTHTPPYNMYIITIIFILQMTKQVQRSCNF